MRDRQDLCLRREELVLARQVPRDREGTSGTLLVGSRQSCKRAGQGHVVVGCAYDLSPWSPLSEVEDFAEMVLGVGDFGEHPAGFGSAAGGADVPHFSRTVWLPTCGGSALR